MKNQFNLLVRRLCDKFSEEMNVTMNVTKGFSKRSLFEEKLCEGLCSTKTLRNLQNGNRNLDKLLQDEILSRLGAAAEEYIYLLDYDEYSRWKARQQILYHITWNQPDAAQRLLEDYRKHYDTGNRLEHQFILSMTVQIQNLLGADRNRLLVLIEEALSLTVPSWKDERLTDLILSIRELNLILEAEQCRDDKGRPERYIEVINYLEKTGWDSRGMAKIYPKAVYFLCRSVAKSGSLKEDSRWNRAKILWYCNRGIDILRENERMYYLWELLGVRGALLDEMQQELLSQGERKRADSLQKIYRENMEYLWALEKIYGEFHLPKETFHYCYLYITDAVSCVNDVIRCRRKMLGMKRRELYENICSEKTLGRLERCENSVQKEIAAKLLERLGLSQELVRAELVTDNPEAGQLMERLRYHENRQNWLEVGRIRGKIETMADMNILNNRQVLMHCEITSQWRKGKLDKNEYHKKLLEVLEMTMPFPVFLKEGEKYLSDEEQSCVRDLMEIMDRDSTEYMLCLQQFKKMYDIDRKEGMRNMVPGMYGIMTAYIDRFGKYRNMAELNAEDLNRADLEAEDLNQADWNTEDLIQADLYSEIICQGYLRLRRMSELPYYLYYRWRNNRERKQKGILEGYALDDTEELASCMVFSRLNRQEHLECCCRKELEALGCER